jgi:glycosyltransferase involved in cell wall biosynthesis
LGLCVTKRILFIEHSETGIVGGSLTGLVHLIRGLDPHHFESTLLLYEPKDLKGELDGTGCRILVLPNGHRQTEAPARKADSRTGRVAEMRRGLGAVRRFVTRELPRARKLLPVIKAERPDLIHLGNGIKPNLDGIVASRLARVACVAHEKGFVRYTPFDKLWARVIQSCVCMTDAVRVHLLGQGVRAPRMPVVYDGLDLAHFLPQRSAEDVRRELGFSTSDLVIGMFGNIQPWKGQDVTLRAMAAVASEFPNLVCLFAGGVVRGAEWYQASLEEFVRAHGLERRVRFLGSRSDVPDLVNAIDVPVHASVTPEPFGRVLIEAMALGKPVVATAAGGPLEIVEPESTGLLARPGDDVEMAAVLRRLLRDPALRASMGEAGRRRAHEHFSLESFARNMQGEYDEVLSG